MGSTREKILQQSLRSFNEKGLDDVSLRSISSELNISVGNLQYHFKKREEIIHELYFQLVASTNKGINECMEAENKFEGLFKITEVMVRRFYEYRFIFQDFNSVMRNHPDIRKHYQKLLDRRNQQFLYFVTALIEQGLMREEELPHQYDNLFVRLQILSDFWMSATRSSSKTISKKSILKYAEVINQTVFPYLTPEGKKEYARVIAHSQNAL